MVNSADEQAAKRAATSLPQECWLVGLGHVCREAQEKYETMYIESDTYKHQLSLLKILIHSLHFFSIVYVTDNNIIVLQP